MKRLTGLSLLEYAGSLSAEEKDRMKAKEWQAAELCFGGERLEKAQELAAEIRAELAGLGQKPSGGIDGMMDCQ